MTLRNLLLVSCVALVILLISAAEGEPQRLVMYFYDFEDSDQLRDWVLEEGWERRLVDGNYVLAGSRHSFARLVYLGNVTAVEVRVMLLRGGLHINVRETVDECHIRYFVGLRSEGVYLCKQVCEDFSEEVWVDADVGYGVWHVVRVEVEEWGLRVFLDGEEVLMFRDENLLTGGGVSFEALDDSEVYVDDLKVEVMEEAPRFVELFSDGVHVGDIELKGREILLLRDSHYIQYGNIYARDGARIVLIDAVLEIRRHEKPLYHWGIRLDGRASLELLRSSITPGPGVLVVVEAGGAASINITDSNTDIHLLEVYGSARAVIVNSRVVFEIGGLVGSYDHADVLAVNSEIGAISVSYTHLTLPTKA